VLFGVDLLKDSKLELDFITHIKKHHILKSLLLLLA